MFRQLGNDVFFVKEPGVWSYNMVSKKITQILTEDVGAMWGLDVYGNKALTVSSYDVIEVDPVAKTAVKHDLTQAGAPGGPQLCMGLAAGAGDVYVGGTGTIARHQLATGQVSYLRATGEAKDAVIVGGSSTRASTTRGESTPTTPPPGSSPIKWLRFRPDRTAPWMSAGTPSTAWS